MKRIANQPGKRIAALLLTAVMAAAGLGACQQVAEIAEVAAKVAQPLPAAEDTLTSLFEITRAMEKSMASGETELTIYSAGVSEPELQNIGENLSTFWGKPVHYSINSEYKGIEGIVPGRAVDVWNITNNFELSNNYYVFDYIKNGTPIPEDKPNAKKIAEMLPSIAAEIFTDPTAGDFEKTLAAHDWLVANLEYDLSTPSKGEENGAYGAFLLGRTMCQGYAEALELLLKCYTDVEIVQVVGEALHANSGGRPIDEPEAEDISGEPPEEGNDEPGDTEAENGGEAAGEQPGGQPDGQADEANGEPPEEGSAKPEPAWGGHAWNAVKIDGRWYQIDATFNDPIGNPEGRTSHFYFGQTDAMMSKNHRWNPEYFPVSDSEDFLFFRRGGLFAEDWEEFEAIVTGLLAEDPIETFEVAIRNATIDEENIQFIYKVRDDLEMLYWSEQAWEDVYVQSVELYYYNK